METLSKWNYFFAAVHLGAAITSSVILRSKAKRTVQMTRMKFDALAPNSESRADIPVELENEAIIDLKYILVSFFAVTSAAHFLYATDFFGRGWYSSQVLGFGWNPFRWVEYSISAGLMIYLISAASGTKDQISAVSAALITPGLMINGFTTERALHQNEIHDWSIKTGPKSAKPLNIDSEIIFSNLIPGWFLYFVHWYIILSNYSKLQKEAKDAGKPLDNSVGFMVYSQLFFFSLFGIIQTYQVYRWFTANPGRHEPAFIGYEKAYIILSAVAKLFLAGTVTYSLRD